MIHHVRVRPRPHQRPDHTRAAIVRGAMQSRPALDVLVVDIAAAVGQEQGHNIRVAPRRGADQGGAAIIIHSRSVCSMCKKK
jgi:hypothetical protein